MTDNFVKIVEVGPRDGLQNEKHIVDLSVKVELINRLSQTGLSVIEAGAFVSSRAVPQMANSDQVFADIEKQSHVSYPVLVPNERGMTDAIQSGVQEIAVFASASEGFSQKNINCSIEGSFDRFAPVFQLAKDNHITVRGYISCVVACPYDGPTDPAKVADLSARLIQMGAYEISLGDTIGVGKTDDIETLLNHCLSSVSSEQLALHLHDTYGHALSGIETGLEMGLRVFDSSVGGLGGCPYAKGATGNIATEKVLNLVHEKRFETGVDTGKIQKIADWIHNSL